MWWKEAIIYQIYPRSFMDSNGDGVGDLEGIIQKLDYLAGKPDSLGVDAIWLSPVYPSPMFDFGYDISDYESIDPVFGDLKIFKKLLEESHKRGIKIIMDLVVNHTSHLHPWFMESRSSKDNPKRDWYIWHDKVKGKEPNNWMGMFGGKAWEWDEKTGQYYYHAFTKEQPDLNWRNPKVKEAVFNMIKFWLDMGVDGFRLDVVNFYFKDAEFRSNPLRLFQGFRPYDKQNHIYDVNRPETHEVLKDLRKLLDSYSGDRMSIGEVVIEPGADLDAQSPSSYLGKNDELHMAFNFAFLYSPWDGQAFKRVVIEWEKRLRSFEGWPNYTLSNHDQKRHITRYAWFYKTKHRAKSAAMMLLTLRGTPFLYYGEEIGMESQWIPKDRIQDPLGHTYWPIYVGRDNARTPMCWNSEKNAGFSNGESWLPVNDNYNIKNVEVESKDPNSLLNFYKKIIRFRKEHSALRNGSIWVLEGTNKHIMGFFRTNEEEKLAVLINLSASECGLGEHASEVKGKILFSISGKSGYFEDVVLAGFEGLIIRVDK